MGNNLLRFTLITLSLAIILISGKSEGMESLDRQRKTQNPLLFELTHKLNPECKGYFLGTHHHLTLDVFSQLVQDIIESAKTVFVEQIEVLTFDLLKELGALTRTPSIKWYDGLTPQEYE